MILVIDFRSKTWGNNTRFLFQFLSGKRFKCTLVNQIFYFVFLARSNGLLWRSRCWIISVIIVDRLYSWLCIAGFNSVVFWPRRSVSGLSSVRTDSRRASVTWKCWIARMEYVQTGIHMHIFQMRSEPNVIQLSSFILLFDLKRVSMYNAVGF